MSATDRRIIATRFRGRSTPRSGIYSSVITLRSIRTRALTPTSNAGATSRPTSPGRDHHDRNRCQDAGGTDSVVGHRGVRLSGGQVQRLALARALATDSEVLVADDVSSALDATTEVELWDAMRAGERTVIGATTKRSALDRADRVVVLVDGVVAAAGPWSELAPAWDHLAG